MLPGKEAQGRESDKGGCGQETAGEGSPPPWGGGLSLPGASLSGMADSECEGEKGLQVSDSRKMTGNE